MFFVAHCRVKIQSGFELVTEEAAERKLLNRIRMDMGTNCMAVKGIGELSFAEDIHEKKAIVNDEFVVIEEKRVRAMCFAEIEFAIEAKDYNEALTVGQSAINMATAGLTLQNLTIDAIDEKSVGWIKIWRKVAPSGVCLFSRNMG